MAAANDLVADSEGVLSEELAVLESIYITELSVEKDAEGWPHTISVLLHPATGMDESKKYVCMTLNFHLPHSYPEEVPDIVVRNPRGLGEEEIHRPIFKAAGESKDKTEEDLIEDMKKLAEERRGGPMLFELIEMAKDCLTEGNIPHCECAICLENFGEGDNFIKTDCYHYFHHACLVRYATAFLSSQQKEGEDPAPVHMLNQEEKILGCPMCRLPLTCDLAALMEEPAPAEETVHFVPTAELLQQQQQMQALYHRQKAKGGIIDLEHEKNKFLVDENTVISLESLRKNLEPKRASAGPTSSAISPVKDDWPASTGLPNTRNGHPPDADLPRGRGNHPNSGRSGQQHDRLHHPAARDPPARDNDKNRKDFRDNRKDFRDNRHDFKDGRNDQYKGHGFRNREDRTRAGDREGRNEKPRDYQGGHRTASSRDSDSQPHNTEKRDRENGPRAGDGEWRNEKSRDYRGGHRTASSRDSDSQPHNTAKRDRENGPKAGDEEWRNEKSRDYQGGRRNASSRDGDTAENRHRNNDPEKRTQTSRDYPRDPRNNQNRDKGGRSRDNKPRESNRETRTGALRGLGDAQHHGSRATDEDKNSEGGNCVPQKGEADMELSRAGNRSGHNGRRADRDRRPRSDLPQNQPEKAGFHVRDEDCDHDQRIKNGASQPNRSGEDASSFEKMSPGYHETGELHGKMPRPAEQLRNSDKASPHNRTDEEAQREGTVLSRKAHTAPRKSAEQRDDHPQASDQLTEGLAQDCRDGRHSESGGSGRKGKKDGRYRRGAGRSRGIELSVSGHPSPQGTEASTDFKAQRESRPHSARSRDKKEVLSNGTAEGGGGEFAGPETLLTNDHHGHKGRGRFYRRGDKVSGQHDKMPGEKQHQRDNKPAAESAPDTQRCSPADQVERSEGIPPRPAVPCTAGCPPGFLVSGPPPGFSVTDSSVKPLPTLNATAKFRPPPGFEFT